MNGPNAQRHQGRRAWPVLALILALAAVVRVLSFRGYYHSDAGAYAFCAHLLASGHFKIGMQGFTPVFPLRVGLFAPVALAFRIGGVNEVALEAYPFLLSMLGVLVAYLAARAMFGVRAGLVAACLAAFLPIDVESASWLLPDMPAAFWMNAGVLLAYAGSRQDSVPGKVASGALTGLALGASWLCKETVLYLLPFVGLYMLWLAAKDRRNVALVLAGIVVVVFIVGLEGWIYHRYVGDYLFRYHSINRNYESNSRSATAVLPVEPNAMPVLTLVGVVRYLVHRITEVSRETLLNADFALVPAAALVACAYAIFRRSRRSLFSVLWFCWLLLVFTFGSASLMTYQPLIMSDRYLYPMLLPAILLVSGLASSLLSPLEPNEPEKLRRERLFWGVLISVCLAGVSLAKAAQSISPGMGAPCRVEREMSRILKPIDPLYTDFRTASALEFFWKYPATDSMHDLQGVSLSQLSANVYVLLNRGELDALVGVYRVLGYASALHDSVPPMWQRLRAKDNAMLYWIPPPIPK